MTENPNTIFDSKVQFNQTNEQAELELATLKTRNNFETYFTDDITHIQAITYSDSPETLLHILDNTGTNDLKLEVVIGDNTIDYRKKLRGKNQLATRLEKLQRQNQLKIFLTSKNNNEVHTKLYILHHKDGTRTNILGSPNLSEQGWGNSRQKNAIATFHTSGNQALDKVFNSWYREHREYGKQFMKDLSKQIENTDDKTQREDVIHAWIDGRNTSQTEEAEFEQNITDQLQDLNVDKLNIVGEWEDPDTTVAITDGNLSPDLTINQSLDGFDNYITDLREETRSIDASINGTTLRASPGAISEHSKAKFGAPKMWFDSKDNLILQTPEDIQLDLTRKPPNKPEPINKALQHLEEYFQTADRFGTSGYKESVKAQMWEALIWFFWAPFINKYAAVYREQGIDLDKYLPSLYIYGEPDSGKGTLARYAFHLLSDGHITEPEDGDTLTTTRLRNVRNVDSNFPVVFDDIDPNDLDTEAFLNFRQKHWTQEINIPALAFISNDTLPRKRIQRRTKVLNLDIQFEDTHHAAKYIHDLTERSNPLFTWFAHLFADREVIMRSDDSDTLAEARNIFKQLYQMADRPLPDYFPEQPAEKEHDIGRREWEDAYSGQIVDFTRRNGNLIAEFDESLSVYGSVRQYSRSLPKEARPRQDGHKIKIRDENAVKNWFPFEIKTKADQNNNQTTESNGLLSRLL